MSLQAAKEALKQKEIERIDSQFLELETFLNENFGEKSGCFSINNVQCLKLKNDIYFYSEPIFTKKIPNIKFDNFKFWFTFTDEEEDILINDNQYKIRSNGTGKIFAKRIIMRNESQITFLDTENLGGHCMFTEEKKYTIVKNSENEELEDGIYFYSENMMLYVKLGNSIYEGNYQNSSFQLANCDKDIDLDKSYLITPFKGNMNFQFNSNKFFFVEKDSKLKCFCRTENAFGDIANSKLVDKLEPYEATESDLSLIEFFKNKY